ncbi:MAG: enoyl-CoA hydratase/isomerase family protein [Phycisphaerales bacterium]|nr:MAG: enoyl-CoA hydratase/isomerase family protein [Phycisphaerales bacterium]
MTPLRHERDEHGSTEGVVTLWLEQSERPVVVLDRDLFRRIDAALDAIGDDVRGLVLASASARVFVAGADLKEIDGLNDAELDEYLTLGARVMGRIASLPCTTVAAINGAALGGGLELAMHCDLLVASMPAGTPEKPARPYPVGLPEAGLGICPGWGGTNLLPARMAPDRAIRMTATGETFDVKAAREHGLIDELLDQPSRLLHAARERAGRRPKAAPRAHPRSIGDDDRREGCREALERIGPELPDTGAARAVARCVRTGVEEGWEAALREERRLLIELRNTEVAREKLAAFFAKSK